MSRLSGYFILAVGILVTIFGALCLLTYIAIIAIYNDHYRVPEGNGVFVALVTATLICAPVLGCGIFVVIAGRRVLRHHRQSESSDVF